MRAKSNLYMEFLHINMFPVGDIRYFQYENSNFISVEVKSKFSLEIYDKISRSPQST